MRFSSFFTQGASGFTHTFPEVLNLILKCKEIIPEHSCPLQGQGFEQPELMGKTQLSLTAPANVESCTQEATA